MALLTIEVEKREITGKGHAGRLRRSGKIPGVLYGDGKDPVALTADPAAVDSILESPGGVNTIFDLELAGSGQRRPVMIHAIQRHPIGYAVTHADFVRVNMKKAVSVRVHINLVGTPAGVKLGGGILEFPHRDIGIECLPGDIPEAISVDISELEVGDSIRATDLDVDPAKVRLTDSTDTLIAQVTMPAAEAEAETGEGEDATAPEASAETPEKSSDGGEASS